MSSSTTALEGHTAADIEPADIKPADIKPADIETADIKPADIEVDVAIAGAGPNGLMLACELVLAGVRPLILEQLPARSPEPKANGMVGQVVRLLDHRGLYERFGGGSGAPRPTPRFVFSAFPLDLSGLEDNPLCLLPLPQRRLEALLEERALELGVQIRRGHELIAQSQDADAVTVQVRGPAGEYRVRARYLVGCDGGHSAVRKAAGIDFPGVTGRNSVSRTAHVSLPASTRFTRDGALEVPGVGRLAPNQFLRTEQGVFVYGLIEPGRPLVSTVEWGPELQDDARAVAESASAEVPMTIEEMSASVRRVLGVELPMGPPTGSGPQLMRRLSGHNTRVAERYRDGRILLVGDAAHVHSAVGGPGLNLGLQDAANLGWKLAAQLGGRAPAGLLDTYEAERRPVAQRVVMHTQAQSTLMAPGPSVTALRELFAELLESKDNRLHIAQMMAGSDVRYPTTDTHPLSGYFVPDLPLAGTGRKGPGRVAELMRGARPILLDLSGRGEFGETAAGWKDRVDVVAAEPPKQGAPADAILIRPDGYVAWAAQPGESARQSRKGLRLALTTWFGEPDGQ